MSHAIVGRIAVCLCLSAASGGITQAIVSGLVQMYTRHTHYNTNELANAVLASMVAVTGCCAFIDPQWALLIGSEFCNKLLHVDIICSYVDMLEF